MFIPSQYIVGMLDYYSYYFGEPAYGAFYMSFPSGNAIYPCSIGNKVFPPFFDDCVSQKDQKQLITDAINEYEFSGFQFVDLSYGQPLSLWHQMLLERGYKFDILYQHYIDFNEPLKIRKSYKNLIKQYRDQYKSIVCYDADIMDEFKAKHLEIAGRQTRCDETWEMQKNMINDDDAFVIYIPGIAYSYFVYSDDEVLYHSAVYDRELTEKQGIPLGHITLYKAIEHIQKVLPRRFMCLGNAVFSGGQKEMGISFFKAGFANSLFPQYVTKPLLRRIK